MLMKKMNTKKIIDIAVDIVLFAVVFSITDYLMLNVIKSVNLWLELGIYIVFYGIVFSCKSCIMYLWKRHRKRKEGESRESEI